jgi:hypothetical protein
MLGLKTSFGETLLGENSLGETLLGENSLGETSFRELLFRGNLGKICSGKSRSGKCCLENCCSTLQPFVFSLANSIISPCFTNHFTKDGTVVTVHNNITMLFPYALAGFETKV